MKSNLRKLVLAAALAGAGVAGAQEASAMTLPAQAGVSTPIQQAGWACGPGWHLNPWGRCVPNRWGWGPRPYWRRHYWRRW